MGASREVQFSALAEPALLLALAALARTTGSLSLSEMLPQAASQWPHAGVALVLAAAALVIVSLAENSRLPVDDPNTHLELTMIHEVMILDNSGFDKALIHMGSYLKFAIYGSLVFNALVPAGWSVWLHAGLFILVQTLFAVIIGLLESFRARNKMNKNPKFILTISAIATIAFVVILIMTSKLT